MALVMKLPHIVTNKGRFVYRRRIPVDLRHLYPTTFLETRMRSQEHGVGLVYEHSALQGGFERMVENARAGSPDAIGKVGVLRYVEQSWANLDDPRTARERWVDYNHQAETLVRSVRGPAGHGAYDFGDGGDQERRELIAEELERTAADPLLYKAVMTPDEAPPKATLADAAKVYEAEKLGNSPEKSARNTFNKIKQRLVTCLGPLEQLPLEDLRRDHAKKVRDYLLSTPKHGGGLLTVSSVQREINSIKAMINVGIRENDLHQKAFNPFVELSMPASISRGPQNSDAEKRDPLPDDVLLDVRNRILTRVRIPELRFMWRLLQATGCRGAEITGLRIEDLCLEHDIPHIWVKWHEERKLKTQTSIRPVPLLGDGLVAAQEALIWVKEHHNEPVGLLPRYYRKGGPDASSQALMAHVRKVTENPRHVVYSLRHNMKSWLGVSGAAERDENRILGHSDAGVGNRYYGGLEDRLVTASRAMKDAMEIAPKGAWDVHNY